jgi:hypothetical protein
MIKSAAQIGMLSRLKHEASARHDHIEQHDGLTAAVPVY